MPKLKKEIEESFEFDIEEKKEHKIKEKKTEVKDEDIIKEDKTEVRKFVIVVLIIAGIISLIVLWWAYSKKYNEFPNYEYNGFKFIKIEGLWNTEWQRGNEIYKIHLRYGPKEAEDVPVEYGKEGFNPTGNMYITFDPTGIDYKYIAVAGAEIALSLSNVFGVQPIAACYRNKTYSCYSRPIVTCDNVENPVIFIKEDSKTKITIDENCLIIQGRGEEIIRAADKVIWIWYGIIK